jgi:hypothetical protein
MFFFEQHIHEGGNPVDCSVGCLLWVIESKRIHGHRLLNGRLLVALSRPQGMAGLRIGTLMQLSEFGVCVNDSEARLF